MLIKLMEVSSHFSDGKQKPKRMTIRLREPVMNRSCFDNNAKMFALGNYVDKITN